MPDVIIGFLQRDKIQKQVELLINAARKSCRLCKHCLGREQVVPTCSLYRATPSLQNRKNVEFLMNKQLPLPRLCPDVRKDDSACAWEGRGYAPFIEKESVFLGEKGDVDV